MNRKIKFYIKLLGILFVLIAFVFPVLTASVQTSWLNNQVPSGAPEDLSASIFSIGIGNLQMNNITFDDAANKFVVTPITDTSGNEFVTAINSLRTVLMILFFVSVALSLIGAFLSLKESRAGGFFMVLGVLIGAGIVGLVMLLRSVVLTALVSSGGTMNGSSAVYFDNQVVISSTTYTWRMLDTISFGFGYYLLIIGILIQLISMFISVED